MSGVIRVEVSTCPIRNTPRCPRSKSIGAPDWCNSRARRINTDIACSSSPSLYSTSTSASTARGAQRKVCACSLLACAHSCRHIPLLPVLDMISVSTVASAHPATCPVPHDHALLTAVPAVIISCSSNAYLCLRAVDSLVVHTVAAQRSHMAAHLSSTAASRIFARFTSTCPSGCATPIVSWCYNRVCKL